MDELDEMDQFPVTEEADVLVDPNMIPTAATEVVMSGEGLEAEYGGGEESSYGYDYAYDDEEHSHHHHSHLAMEEEVVVSEEVYEGGEDSWKESPHKKMNLYNVIEDKMYMNEEKQEKRARIDQRQFHYTPATPSNQEGDYHYGTEEGIVQDYPDYSYSSRKTTPDRTCPGCGMQLRRSVYYHHARMIREKGACNLFTPQRFPCPECDQRIGTLEKLCQHMEQIHHAPTQIKTLMFTNEEDFKSFRLELEGKGGNFRMARGNKKNKKGVVQYFRCNRLQTLSRSQTFRPVDNPPADSLPSRKKKGRLQPAEAKPPSAKQVIRTENSCTAFYNKAYLDNGTIEVRYCDHHLHDDEKLRLPDAIRARVIELARKNLPHIVVLMIIKDERFKYCDRNSANDRRIQDMKTQDIRQVLAGNNRAEKNRAARGELPRDMHYDKDHSDLVPLEEELTKGPWTDIRPNQKIDRLQLTRTELRYLDLFDGNREEVMNRLNEKTRVEQDKKMAFDSFIHRLSSSQEIMKNLCYRDLAPTESTLLKLKKTYHYLSKIEEMLLNPIREPPTSSNTRFSSYIGMMEEEARNERERNKNDGRGDGNIEEIDVVGIDEDDYRQHHVPRELVVEEEVDDYRHLDNDEDEMEHYLRRQAEQEEAEMRMRRRQETEELNVEHPEEEEVLMEEVVEDGVVEMQGIEEDDESAEPMVTRAGRIVKKKPTFDT